MNGYFFNKIYLLIVFIAFTSSCSSDLDFNQKIGELSPYFRVTDVFNSEVFYNASAQTLVTPTPLFNLPPKTIPFDIGTKITNNGIVQYIKKVVFHAALTNTTNNICTITVVFQNNTIPLTQYTTTISVPPNTTKTDIIFLESDIPNLKSVTNILFTGTITLNSATIPSGKLSVTSDATIYL